MNEPITIERAQIGRAMYFPRLEWDAQITTFSANRWATSNKAFQHQEAISKCGSKGDKIKEAVFFNKIFSSKMKIKLQKKDRHHHLHVKIDVKPMGNMPNVVIWALSSSAHHTKSHHAILVLSIRSHSQLWAEIIHDSQGSETIIANDVLEDNVWSSITVQRRGHHLVFKINDQKHVTVELPRGLRLGHFLHLGKLPHHVVKRMNSRKIHDFNGCIQNLGINFGQVDLWSSGIESQNLQSCYQNTIDGLYFETINSLTLDNLEGLNEISFEANVERCEGSCVLLSGESGTKHDKIDIQLLSDMVRMNTVWKHGNLLSHFFCKNIVKVRFY